jgi:hypothetical protein
MAPACSRVICPVADTTHADKLKMAAPTSVYDFEVQDIKRQKVSMRECAALLRNWAPPRGPVSGVSTKATAPARVQVYHQQARDRMSVCFPMQAR